MEDTTMEKYYTLSEVGKILGLSRKTVYTLRKDGKLKFVKVGGSIRVSEKALKELMKPEN